MLRLFAMVALWFAVCGTAAARPLLLISTENGPDHVQTRLVQRFVERVQACCADRIDVEHRFGATLFRDRDVLAALTQGKVGMAVPGTWQLDRIVPDISVFMLPLFYGRTEAEARRVQDGPSLEPLSRQLEGALGAVVLGRWITLGFADVFTTGTPLASVKDLKGLRIRSPGGLANELRLRALGAEPVTIAWPDLPNALADGRIDGLLTTFATLASAGLEGGTVRYALEDHQYVSQYVPLVSDELWRGLDPATRQDLRDAWEAGAQEGRAAMSAAQAEARARAAANGLRIITPAAQDSAAARASLIALQPAIARRVGVDPAVIDATMAALDGPVP